MELLEGYKGSKRYICTYTDTKILATDVQERKKRRGREGKGRNGGY